MSIELLEEQLDNFKEIVETQIGFDPSFALSTLEEIKVLLTKCEYLSQKSPSLPVYERLLFREILELAFILSIRIQSREYIYNFFQQLRFFYFSNDDLPISERMFTIIDTYLLVCFSLADSGQVYQIDFQTDLAQIQKKYKNNMHIQYILDVEQAVSNNVLSEIVKLQKQAPSSLFEPFMEELVIHVKISMAKNICLQCKINLNEMTKYLQMNNEEECKQFLDQHGFTFAEDGSILIPPSPETKHVETTSRQEEIIRSAKQFIEL